MKILIIKKRILLAVISLILAAVMLMMCLSFTGAYAVFYNQSLRKIPIYRVDKKDKVVALSFDAAYGADKTEGIMNILKEYEAEATFFLVGFWIDNNTEMTKKIYDNGFEIGTHSNNHSHMSKFSYEQCVEDLKQSILKIENCIGEKPKLFRAPYGEYNNTLIEAAQSLELKTIQWDVDSHDWMDKTTTQICSRVLDRIKEGSIVLFHNNADHVLEVLPIILERLKSRGYTCVKLSDLVYSENYTIDNKGEQHLES